MPNAQNVATLAKIKEELQEANSMWVVDYRGLSVKDAQQLRRDITEAGGHMVVYKNKLMHLALTESDLPTLDDVLEGPNAFVFSSDDPAASAKAVKEFAENNEALEIKGGIMDGAAYDAAQVEAIASLPTRDELYASIASAIAGVARGLAVALNGIPQGLAQSIKQVAEQKEAA